MDDGRADGTADMTSHRCRRLGLSVVAALLAGAPLLWGQAAYAQGEPTVTFTGGCASDAVGPDDTVRAQPRRADVPVGAEIRLVNQLGRGATLLLDGEAAAELPPGATVALVLHEGPVVAALRMSCPGGEVTGTATIGVAEPARDPSLPPDLLNQHRAGLPDQDGPSTEGGDGSADEDRSEGGGSPGAAGPAGGQGGPPSLAQGVEPVDGPNGVLALLAAACVAGVSAGAIRTISTQRATQL
jgi:hypothetical protein